MARYDRIAPLNAPSRQQAFPGWLALRDLEGRERDTELGRRARLRFLAIRMIRRVLREGFDRIAPTAFDRQIENVREELGHLPSRDVERAQLAQFLHRFAQRNPVEICDALLEVGETIEQLGHPFGAEEFYTTAYELAEQARLTANLATALRLLARLQQRSGRWEESDTALERATELAARSDARNEWTEATRLVARGKEQRGFSAEAERILREVLERARGWGVPSLASGALNDLSEIALRAGNVDAAADFAWSAYSNGADDLSRGTALLQLAQIFRRSGLYPAAETCYEMIQTSAFSPSMRTALLVEQVVCAAESGDHTRYDIRSAKLIERIHDSVLPAARARLELQLGRASLLVGANEAAREHLREAVTFARRLGQKDVLGDTETLLAALERVVSGEGVPELRVIAVSDRARRIAASLETAAPLTPA